MTVYDTLVTDWFSRDWPRPTPRDVRTWSLPGKVDAIYGIRRAGKTWMLLSEMLERVRGGVPREHNLYVSFEDERLRGAHAMELGGLLDAWFRRCPDAARGPAWLVLDEVQEIPGWESFVRRLVDRGNVQLAVTGSLIVAL